MSKRLRPPILPGLYDTFDAEEAERRKTEGVALALENPAYEDTRAQVEGYIEALARSGEPFTSDDVYAMADADGAPIPDDFNMGSLFVAAHKRGLIELVWCPSVKSKRPNSHARTVKVWRGVRRQ